jgi:hypothetical protein
MRGLPGFTTEAFARRQGVEDSDASTSAHDP